MNEDKKVTAKDVQEKLDEAVNMSEAIKFNTFDKEDGRSFAGATRFKGGEDPLIAYLDGEKEVSSDGGKKEYDQLTIIMDGLAIEAIFQNSENDDMEDWKLFLTKDEDKPLDKKAVEKMGNKLGLKTPISPKQLKSKKFKKIN